MVNNKINFLGTPRPEFNKLTNYRKQRKPSTLDFNLGQKRPEPDTSTFFAEQNIQQPPQLSQDKDHPSQRFTHKVDDLVDNNAKKLDSRKTGMESSPLLKSFHQFPARKVKQQVFQYPINSSIVHNMSSNLQSTQLFSPKYQQAKLTTVAAAKGDVSEMDQWGFGRQKLQPRAGIHSQSHRNKLLQAEASAILSKPGTKSNASLLEDSLDAPLENGPETPRFNES